MTHIYELIDGLRACLVFHQLRLSSLGRYAGNTGTGTRLHEPDKDQIFSVSIHVRIKLVSSLSPNRRMLHGE